MAFLSLTYVVLCMSVWTAMGQIETVDYTPVITPYSLAGRLTSNTVILMQPRCYFDNVTGLPCTSDQCEIWLVPAIDTGVSTFDTDKNNANIDSLSPYPTAFASNTSKNYFLTKVGLQKDFPCSLTTAIVYFRLGSGESCSTTNCNGILPVGSRARFKYLLVNPSNKTVLAESRWSNNITLYSLKDPDTIDDGLAGRSAAMIVITAILCAFLALLLLLLLIILILAFCWRTKKQIIQVPGSLRIRSYDTHNFKDPDPYVNPAYEDDLTLPRPKVLASGSAQDPTNPIKLRSYTGYDYPLPKPATEL